MKGLAYKFLHVMKAAVAVAFMALIPTSCVLDGPLPECPRPETRLRFVYEYNMERANAFHNQVHCLSLHVYDKDGNYVGTYTETRQSVLGDEAYRMPLNLPDGDYHVVVYGGMACEASSFSHTASIGPGASLPSLGVRVNPECLTDDRLRRLHDHFYGSADIKVTQNEESEHTVYMMRNTNTIQVALQHLNGSPIDCADFNYTITDDNTLMDAGNNLLAAGEVAYSPYETVNFTTGTKAGEGQTEVNAAVARFTVSRLVQDKATSCTLHVTRKSDGSSVLKLPIVNYMLMFKDNHDATKPMSDQEYLDRENSWRFVFFLDESNGNSWVNTRIIINDWKVVVNNTEF